ncbi:hypothetical protein ACIA8R_08590 [Nonomuraea sp. NPDC051191]|uniref:hypothetical protein n=1 Tax=Nonomuraea sp. NPDC051191 TaxID=3364372 RepID=UPI00379256BD
MGTLRRDCLDHLLIHGERHLRKVLTEHEHHFNDLRGAVASPAELRCGVSRDVVVQAARCLGGEDQAEAVLTRL